MRTLITQDVAKSEILAPMHWTAETASAARIDALVPGRVDPISGHQTASQLARFCGQQRRDDALVQPLEKNPVTVGWRAELGVA